jgi:hypothetical protein
VVSRPVLPWIPRTVVLQEPIHSAFHSGRYGYLQDYEQSSTPREIMCFVTFVCHVPLLRYSTVPQVREASDGQMEGTLVLLRTGRGFEWSAAKTSQRRALTRFAGQTSLSTVLLSIINFFFRSVSEKEGPALTRAEGPQP